MDAISDRLGRFVQAGQAAQAAVDRAIERAELVRLVRDRGAYVRSLAEAEHTLSDGIGRATWRDEYDAAVAAHSRACARLDEFDHQPGRAPA